MNKTAQNIINDIHLVLSEKMKGKGISFQIDDLSNKHHTTINIEPTQYKGTSLHGMVILFEDGIFEVVEMQAGENENELHIFLVTKSFKVALRNMLKGNKRSKSKILKIWN